MNSGDEFLDHLARRAAFHTTRAEARRLLICVRCGAPQTIAWTREDMAEWRISALCPGCFDRITQEPDE